MNFVQSNLNFIEKHLPQTEAGHLWGHFMHFWRGAVLIIGFVWGVTLQEIFRKIFQELSRRQCDMHSTAPCGRHDWVRYRFGSLQIRSQNRNQSVIYWYSIVQSRAVITWSRITWYYIHHFSDWARVYITILIHKMHRTVVVYATTILSI